MDIPIFETRQGYTTWIDSRFGHTEPERIELVASYVFFTADGNITGEHEDSAYFIRRIQNGVLISYEFCVYMNGDEDNQKPILISNVSMDKRAEDCATWEAFAAVNLPEIVKV